MRSIHSDIRKFAAKQALAEIQKAQLDEKKTKLREKI